MARTQFVLAAIGLAVVAGSSGKATADDGKAGGMGRLESPTGTLLRRAGADKDWKVVAHGAAVPDTELLLALPGVRAAIRSSSGAVHLTLSGNVPQLSPLPALESAVTLRRSSDYDLDLILDRGRISVANTKQTGAANVRVRARDEIWELTLKEPGAAASIELNARWAPGVPYRTQYAKGEEPNAEMALLVLQGTAELRSDDRRHALRAPDGPALFVWHSQVDTAGTPQPIRELPPWMKPGADKEPPAMAVHEAMKPLIASLADKPVIAALADFLASADKAASKEKGDLIRQLAVTGFGAVDDLAGLWKAISSEKTPVERLVAIETLRHWIGRKAGQDATLARFLIREQEFTAEQATTVLQLLHSYGKKGIEDPVTYEVLIADLQHEKLPIRELAAWHLYRLAPGGRDIPYDATASQEKREETVKKWKQLIPNGELPPAPKRK